MVMILLVIGGLYLNMIQRETNTRNTNLQAIGLAEAMKQVCAAADTYSTRNWSTLSTSQTTNLSIAQLRGTPPLTADTLTTLQGVPLFSSINMLPAGCLSTQCKADIHIWTGGFTSAGAANNGLASAIARRIGRLASVSLPESPTIFMAWRGTRTDPNPTGQAAAVMIRCGDANNPTQEASIRGNTQLTNSWSVGNQSITSNKTTGTNVTQISGIASGTCSQVNALAMDNTGRYFYCDGSSWQPTAVPVQQYITNHSNQVISMPGDNG